MRIAQLANATRRRRVAGFTLIEVLIVSALVAILAAIAIPSYRGYIRRSKSGAAQQCLTKLMTAQERYRADRGTYANAVSDLATYGVDEDCAVQNSASGETYELSVSNVTGTTFTGQASGMLSGSETTDIWTINQDGKLAHKQDGT